LASIGDTIDRFVIEAVLGEGGMGRVYRALDPRLGRRVALKVMLAEGASETVRAEAAARMEREARAAAAFNHPNVVAIYEVGEFDGSPYIAMELVAGRTLRSLMGDVRTSEDQRLEWLIDVARGLGAAHRAGLVHRDIKPDNVMITTDGVVKVLDFGIARRSELAGGPVDPAAPTISPHTPAITAEGVAIGTPQYMAPEQIRGEPLDGRADQFAWGVMAFEVLAGKLPWANAPSAPALFAAVLTANAPSVRDLVPTLDRHVGEVIARALAKTCEARFASMDELIAAIEAKGVRPSLTADTRDVALAATTAQPAAAKGDVSPRAVTVDAPPPMTTGAAVVASTTAPAVPARASRHISGRVVAAAVAAAVVLGGGVVLYRAVHRPAIRYCAFLEDTVDGPRCVAEIAAEVAARRLGLTHRVTELGGRVVRVEDVSFAGRRVGDAERTDVVRDEGGPVREVIVRDRHDNIERWEKWSEGGKRVDFVDDDGVAPRHLRETAITTIRRELDATGRFTSERYFAAGGRPACDEHKAYGYAYAFGHTVGRPIRKTVLGADGKPAAELRGESVIETADDGTPGGADVRYFDLEGKPAAVDGVFHHHRVWCVAGEQTESVELGVHDEPIVNLDAGVHREHVQWDPTKRTITETLFDEADRQHPAKSSSYSAVRYTYDERGREVLQEFLDAQGNRVYPKNAAAARRSGWDDHDDRILTEHLDVTGALMQGEWGYARQIEVRDEHGFIVEQRHYDETGKLALWRDGGAIQKVTRDTRGLALAEAAFDASEHPVPTVHGWSTARVRYAGLRNIAELSFFGPDGHPCINSEGFAVLRETYDDSGDGLTRTYLDATGAPAMYRGEYATERVTRDALGNHAEDAYLDGHGERVLRREGFSAVRFARDRNGDVVAASYFGKRDEPIAREGGYAKKTTAYDDHRRPVEMMLFDASGVPAAGSAGWTIERDAYDDRGLVVRRDHLDAGRNPVLTRSGSASVTWVYDARGNVVEETSRGVDGRPVATSEGFASARKQYDERDQLVLVSLLGADGKPATDRAGWSIRQLRYGEMGNLVEEAFFDGEHRPTALKDTTYASVVSRFDARQRLVETAYLDVGGAPTKGPEGVAAIRYVRDGYGHAIETAYLDGAGAAALSTEGKLVVRARYDDAGRPIEELYVDGAGALHVSKDGCAGHRTKYDALGRKVEESCVDSTGQVGMSGDGWAIRRTLHDARGNAVDESTYGADGALRADGDGVARRRNQFDERNLLQETTYFDASDRPTHDRHGVHAVKFEYGESGKRIGKTELDEKGKVVAAPLPSPKH
jgi:serine/threonine-protein kinase